MEIKQSIGVLVITTFTIVAGNIIDADEESNISFFNSMARSGDVLRSSQCFDYYIPLIDNIVKTYQRDHNACLQDSRDGRSKAEDATLIKRLALAATANNSCELLSQCGGISSPEKLFTCYAIAGSDNAKTMYEINLNSTDHLTDLREQFRLVENAEYKCTNETKRKYEKDSTAAYGDFNKCNMGLIDVPQPTEEPVTSQTSSTKITDASVNTKIPESSTEAAVVTTANTDAPQTPQSPDVSQLPPSPDVPQTPRRRNKFNFNKTE